MDQIFILVIALLTYLIVDHFIAQRLRREQDAINEEISSIIKDMNIVLMDHVNILNTLTDAVFDSELTDEAKERVYAGIEQEIEGSNCNEEDCIHCQIVELERKRQQCLQDEDYWEAQAITLTIEDLRREL